MFAVSCVSLLGFWLWEGKGCVYLDGLLNLPNVLFAEKVIPWTLAQRVSEWLECTVDTGWAERCPGL